MNTTDTPDDTEFIAHLRRTLHTVAETITDDATKNDSPPAPLVRRTGRRAKRKHIVAATAVAVAGLGLVAWNTFEDGEIERIPTEDAIMSGATDGYQWWLIPSAAIGHTNPCGVAFPGVELVSAATNRPGQEWNTGGVNYGRNLLDDATTDSGGTFSYDCSNPTSEFDETAWFNDPTLMNVGFTRLGRNNDSGSPWGAFAALHPTIEHIDVIVDGATIDTVDTVTKVDEPNGVRYAGFTIPADVCTFRLDYRTTGTDTPVASNESTIC